MIDFLGSDKEILAYPQNKKDDNLSPPTDVNLLPMSEDAKFCGESDFIGLNPAISRNWTK